MKPSEQNRTKQGIRFAVTLAAALLLSGGLSGCLVAGYSSRGGGFIWPGGLGLVVLVLVVLWLLRRR